MLTNMQCPSVSTYRATIYKQRAHLECILNHKCSHVHKPEDVHRFDYTGTGSNEQTNQTTLVTLTLRNAATSIQRTMVYQVPACHHVTQSADSLRLANDCTLLKSPLECFIGRRWMRRITT